MPVFTQERRLSPRYKINIPIKVRVWKSDRPESCGETLNVSEGGICFRTHALLGEGETVEVRFDMPEEVVDEPAAEWLCTGQVLKVEPVGRLPLLHVRVRFDCYQVARPNGTTTIRIDLNSLRFGAATRGE